MTLAAVTCINAGENWHSLRTLSGPVYLLPSPIHCDALLGAKNHFRWRNKLVTASRYDEDVRIQVLTNGDEGELGVAPPPHNECALCVGGGGAKMHSQ